MDKKCGHLTASYTTSRITRPARVYCKGQSKHYSNGRCTSLKHEWAIEEVLHDYVLTTSAFKSMTFMYFTAHLQQTPPKGRLYAYYTTLGVGSLTKFKSHLNRWLNLYSVVPNSNPLPRLQNSQLVYLRPGGILQPRYVPFKLFVSLSQKTPRGERINYNVNYSADISIE